MLQVNIFFSLLVLLSLVTVGIYCAFKDKKAVLTLIALSTLSLLLINFYPMLCFIFLIFLLLPFFKKMSYSKLIVCCMISSITLANFILILFMATELPYMIFIALLSVTALSALGILGIFENKLVKYLLISNLIQLIFVLADLSVAKLAGKIQILGTIQIFNYTLAGLLLFMTLGLFYKEKISDLQGFYYSNKANACFAIVAALSLAGLPGLNIFVSEWYLFITSFSIFPIITILGIFAALILFIMYFKIAYILLVGRAKKILIPKILIATTGALAGLCLLFGLLPQLQLLVLI